MSLETNCLVEVKTEVGKLSESARRQGERLAVVEEQNRTGKEAREKIALQAESAHQAVLASVISFKTEDKKSHDALEVRLQAIERAGTVTSTRQVMFLGIAGAVAGVIGGVGGDTPAPVGSCCCCMSRPP